jgi:hypothetical protein
MIRLPICLPIAESCAYGYGGAAPAPPTERVQNGDFSSSTGWAGSQWVIAAGSATNTPGLGNLTNTLVTPLVGGEAFSFSFDVLLNPANTGMIVSLVNSGGSPAPQQIFSDGSTPGTKTSSGTVGGAYDQLRISAIDDPGSVIDNVSLIA